MKHIVIFTGAGMSAKSGISTFRGHSGSWRNHRMEEVATQGAWELKLGDYCEKVSQLRPYVVWFGEPVPMIEKAGTGVPELVNVLLNKA